MGRGSREEVVRGSGEGEWGGVVGRRSREDEVEIRSGDFYASRTK